MAADYYTAETEDGHHVDDPSEDALYELIGDLNHDDNTFITIEPAVDEPTWYASVAVLDEGSYEIERRDADRSEHDLSTDTDRGRIAQELTIWLAARGHPRRPPPA